MRAMLTLTTQIAQHPLAAKIVDTFFRPRFTVSWAAFAVNASGKEDVEEADRWQFGLWLYLEKFGVQELRYWEVLKYNGFECRCEYGMLERVSKVRTYLWVNGNMCAVHFHVGI